jgi:hypothetical protein
VREYLLDGVTPRSSSAPPRLNELLILGLGSYLAVTTTGWERWFGAIAVLVLVAVLIKRTETWLNALRSRPPTDRANSPRMGPAASEGMDMFPPFFSG